MLPFKRILWPTDFSDASYKALESVKELAATFASEVWAIHVMQPISVYSAELTLSLPAYEQELFESTRTALQTVIQERSGEALQMHPVLKIGGPAGEIVSFATEKKLDIIVMATHGESAFHHFIVGSVTDKVVRLATCPVLVLRVPQQTGHTA